MSESIPEGLQLCYLGTTQTASRTIESKADLLDAFKESFPDENLIQDADVDGVEFSVKTDGDSCMVIEDFSNLDNGLTLEIKLKTSGKRKRMDVGDVDASGEENAGEEKEEGEMVARKEVKLANSENAGEEGTVNGDAAGSEEKKSEESATGTGAGTGMEAGAEAGAGAERFYVKIRGIPWHSTESDIEKFFGPSIAIQHIHMLRNAQKQLTGEAYVCVGDHSTFTACTTFHKKNMGRRYIEVYTSSEADYKNDLEREDKCLHGFQPVREDSRIVRLRGLPYSANTEDVKVFFSHDPTIEIVKVHFQLDHMGRPSGTGFVELGSDPDQMRRALEFHKKTIGSRYIEVFESSAGELRDAGRGNDPTRPPRDYRGGRDGGYGRDRYSSGGRGYYRGRSSERDRYGDRYGGRSGGGGYAPRGPVEDSHCVKVEHIPITASHEDVTAFFQRVGLTPHRIHRKQGGDEAFVEFYSPADAARSVQQNRQYIGRESVDVFRVPYNEMADVVGLPRQERPAYYHSTTAAPIAQQPMYGAVPSHAGSYPSYSAPVASMPADQYAAYGRAIPDPYAANAASYGADYGGVAAAPAATGSARMKLQGLPYRTSKEEILSFFQGYDVVPHSVEFGVNHEGRPDGQAYVQFRNLAEAERAFKERNRQYIGDRYIKLFLN